MGNGGGIGGFMTDLMGGGNDYNQDTPEVNMGDYAYGGRGAGDFAQDAGLAQGRMGPQINYANAGQSRGFALGSRDQSMQALDLAHQAALGQGTSVAQQQLMTGRDAALQNSMAMANSVRGGGANLAASQMSAQRQQGELMGQTNQQSAMLRAQEMATARQQYGLMASQQRAQDLQAQGLDAQQAQAQAQLEMQQRGLNDQYTMGMYGLGARAAEDVQQGGEQMTRDRAAAELGAGQINANVAAGNAGQNASGGNQAMGMAAGVAGGLMLMSDERLKRDVRPLDTRMGPDPESDAIQRQRRLNAMIGRMGGGGNTAYARGVSMGANLAGMFGAAGGRDNARQPRSLAQQEQQDMMGGGGTSGLQPGAQEMMSGGAPLNSGPNLGARGGPEVYDLSNDEANAVPYRQPMPQQMGGGYAADHLVGDPNAVNGAMLMSDARLKQGVGGASGNAVDHFLGSLQPVEYHYKPGVPGEDPRQPRYGILAQDVAQSPMGRSVVENTQMGMGINVPHATGALMAGEGRLYARQQRLEDAFAHLRARR